MQVALINLNLSKITKICFNLFCFIFTLENDKFLQNEVVKNVEQERERDGNSQKSEAAENIALVSYTLITETQ